MAGQQAIAIAVSKDGLATILGGVLPLLSRATITIPDMPTIDSPVASWLEPEHLRIYNIQVQNLVASLVAITQHASQSGASPSCLFDVTTRVGFHVTTGWEEWGDTGGP